MKLAVSGWRGPLTYEHMQTIEDRVEHAWQDAPPNSIVLLVGDAKGVDTYVKHIEGVPDTMWYSELIEFKADWDQHGRSAGPIRNRQILDAEPDFCLVFPHASSKGTIDFMTEALRRQVNMEVCWLR